ncbi:MAG: hypothetical protein IH987_14805 [Planctomycetes bacterium]|nr:hypothetical protein [Planctomycetota bacterium]
MMSLFRIRKRRRPGEDSSPWSWRRLGVDVGFIAGLCGLVTFVSLTVRPAHGQTLPSFSNKRANNAGSKTPAPRAGKKACDTEPSTVTFGKNKAVGKQRLPSGQTPFRALTSAPRWQCDKPNVMTKPVWGGESIVCEFEFQNTGTKYLNIRAKAG